MSWPAEPAYPFLSGAFHRGLENSGAVCADTGWHPIHVQADDFWMPLYRKDHSFGEYVFDFAWADAYRRNGLAYYPRLVSAVPFTPVAGPRWRGSLAAPAWLWAQLEARLEAEAASSWHLLFPDAQTRATLAPLGLIEREACHFRWFNQAYPDFDTFLGALVSRRRKSIRRERRRVREQGLSVQRRTGADIPDAWWRHFEHFYAATYYKHGQMPYLPASFFAHIRESMTAQLMMVLAFHDGEPAAAALYFFDHERLYGRYWGCGREYDVLHFELCYYQGIEFAIEQGLAVFDPGVQGEHKILRGFEPVITTSLHYLREPALNRAVADFCARESEAVRAYQHEAHAYLPYRA